jgi:hypothetical protein
MISRFNPPAESARTIGFGNQAASAREIPEEPACTDRISLHFLWQNRTQRKVTVDAEKSDGKKKSDDGRREK